MDKRPNWSHPTNIGSLRCLLIPFRDINDQRILKYNLTRHSWPYSMNSGSLRCYPPLISISMQKKNKTRYQLILSRNTDDKRILQSNWTRDTTGNTQPTVVVSHDYLHVKMSKISIGSFQIFWWSKNSATWLDNSDNWPHPTKTGNLRHYIPLIISIQKTKTSLDFS